MKYRTPACIAAAFAMISLLSAATLPFRSGEVLAAELSTTKPQINNENTLAIPKTFEKPRYAAVVVAVQPERALTIYDYTLEFLGAEYPCIALRAGTQPFDMDLREITQTSPYEKYTLLFLVDGKLVGQELEEKITLKSVAGPDSVARTVLRFNNRGAGSFTAPNRIPRSGILKVNP